MTPPPVEPRATDGSSTETTSDQPVATTSAGGFNGRDGTGNGTDSSCVLPITDRQVDQPRVAAAIREILIAIGEDPDRDGLQDTPARVARAYQEIYGGLSMGAEDALTITFDVHHDELIIVKDIELYSMCEHHLLPFHGVAHVGYVPNKDGRVTGLSKLARLVDVYARRPQVQERLTAQIADALEEVLDPRGVIVVIECEHTCMSMRGVRRPGSTTLTSAVRGQLRNAVTRSEALDLILGGRK